MRKILAFVLIFSLGITNISATSEIILEERADGHSKLMYADDTHAVWTKNVPNTGTYIIDYVFDGNVKEIVGGGDGKSVGMSQESDTYVAGKYICWLEFNSISKLLSVGYAKSGTDKKGICTTYEAQRYSCNVDRLGNVFWAERTGDAKTCGVYVFNIDTDTKPKRIFAYPLGEFSSRVYANNGYAVWYYPNKTGKMDLYVYSPDGTVDNISEKDNSRASFPCFFGNAIYWKSGKDLIRYDVLTKTKESVYTFDYTNLWSLEFASNPDSETVVMQGMRLTGTGTTSESHYFIFTYDPVKKIGKECPINDINSMFVGSSSSQSGKVVFECTQSVAYENRRIMICDTNNNTVETLATNDNNGNTYLEVPRIKGNKVGWSKIIVDEKGNHTSSVYTLDINK